MQLRYTSVMNVLPAVLLFICACLLQGCSPQSACAVPGQTRDVKRFKHEPDDEVLETEESEEVDEESEAAVEDMTESFSPPVWVEAKIRPFVESTRGPVSVESTTDRPRLVLTSASPHLTRAEKSAYQVVINYLKTLPEMMRRDVLNDEEWFGWLKENHPTLSHLFTPESLRAAILSHDKPPERLAAPQRGSIVQSNASKVSSAESKIFDELGALPGEKSADFIVTSDQVAKIKQGALESAQLSGLQLVYELVDSENPLIYDEVFTETGGLRTARNTTHMFVLVPKEGTKILPSPGSSLTPEELKQLNGT